MIENEHKKCEIVTDKIRHLLDMEFKNCSPQYVCDISIGIFANLIAGLAQDFFGKYTRLKQIYFKQLFEFTKKVSNEIDKEVNKEIH